MIRLWRAVFLLSFALLSFTGLPARAQDSAPAALLRGLDKITGRAQDLTIALGEKTRFGSLDILLHFCYQRPPEERPETAVFVQIFDTARRTDSDKPVFSGWMFASSPAVNTLEHRVYDVWPVKCITDSGAAAAGSR